VEDVQVGGMDLPTEVQAAVETWTASGCAPEFPGASFDGVFDGGGPIVVTDGVTRIGFEDGWLEGYPGATFSVEDEFDIVLDPDFALVDEAAAADPACDGAYSLRATLVRLIGFAFGLGPSSVPTASLSSESGAACSTEASTLDPDDRVGFAALYGPESSVACFAGEPGVLAGKVPLDVSCGAETDDGTAIDATFTLDGQSEPGPYATFTLREEGRFPVTGCATVALEGCVELCATWEIVACEPPVAEFDLDRRDRVVTNLTPLDTEGCVSSVQWRLLAGEEEVWTSGAWAPDLPADVEADRIQLVVRGPGGESVVEERLRGGCGCASGGAGAGPVGLLLAGLLTRRRGSSS
jgi:uncharacterized protein (TIGR03382 family)